MEEKKKTNILSNMFAKIVAFFVLAVSFGFGLVGTVGSFLLLEYDVYVRGTDELIHDSMVPYVWEDVRYVLDLYRMGDTVGMAEVLEGYNVSMEIYEMEEQDGAEPSGKPIWSNYDGAETKFSFNCFTSVWINEETKDVLCRVYVDDLFPYSDVYKSIYDNGVMLGNYQDVLPTMAVCGLFFFLCAFIFLMCSAGHRRGQEGITGGILYFFHFDVLTVVFGVVTIFGVMLVASMLGYGNLAHFDTLAAILGGFVILAIVVWCTIYCMEFAVELKMRTLLKHTLIYTIVRGLVRICKKIWRTLSVSIKTLIHGLPVVTNVMLVYIGFAGLQFFTLFFFCMIWQMDGDVLLLCFLEKLLLLPVVIYFALVCKKLQQGSEALAEGNLNYKLDTSKMLMGFKEHGENLNRIGVGMSRAVEERMRSEHLKTELITNVSHDLKTPLTSIINYADLIGTLVRDHRNADLQTDGKEQLEEYSEVLLRQSKRLKKLLEDLVEASKATTGNLEVNLEPCEIGVMLSQAVGEYEQRFAEKHLDLIVKQPQEAVNIQADGRHLWRVFDNLFNNIYKYAQENSRVYLTVEHDDSVAKILFRNMSKFPLDVSGEELAERFVRGDKSRNMEGNGLGLSIAGSLVDLQNGSMEIVTDGDLFKVIIQFPTL